jgi:signal transduction histidine kinase
LGKISTSAERLHILVEDLLSLSRLESKPDQIESQLNSMQSLFIETADNYRRRVDSLDQQIVLDIDERVGDFYFDRFRINQVLDNLVENVFRYASDFKQLTLQIRLESDLNEVCCAVIDDGPGIPAKDVPHIFERFYRVDKGRSRDRGGTGLGLSITKHIVQSHGGRIYAESDLGQGVAIYFCLPYRN